LLKSGHGTTTYSSKISSRIISENMRSKLLSCFSGSLSIDNTTEAGCGFTREMGENGHGFESDRLESDSVLLFPSSIGVSGDEERDVELSSL
jgi:hypothetical protein